MEFIRFEKVKLDYDLNIRYCFYGLDVDLVGIMFIVIIILCYCS